MSAPQVDPIWHVEPDGSLRFQESCEAQAAFIGSPAFEILFSGMYGSGKSVGGCIKAWKLSERYALNRGAVVRRRYSDLLISTLRLFPRLFGEAMWRDGLLGGDKEPTGYRFRNGSQIDFLGMSGEREGTNKLLSTEYGWLMFDEATELTEAEYEGAIGRLRYAAVPIRQAFSMCNPGSPHHWLYHRFQISRGANQQWRDDNCPRCAKLCRRYREKFHGYPDCRYCKGSGTVRRLARELFMSGATDNDESHPAEYIAWRNSLTGLRAARYRDGRWVAYEGGVFEKYDPNIHLCDRPADWDETWGGYPPPDWPRIRGIDLGYDNPFVCQWWAIDHNGHWWRYREIYRSFVTIPNHARRIIELEAEEHAALVAAVARLPEDRREDYTSVLEFWQPAGSYCDHDKGERAQLEEAGVWTMPAKKDISAGLDHVIDMMNPDQPGGNRVHLVRGALVDGPDQRLLHGERAPTCTEDEMPGYVWDKNVSGQLAGRRKGIPVDRDNHGLDAMRYALYSHAIKVQVAVY